MAQKPTLVVALGGNALLKRGEPLDVRVQQKNIAIAAEKIAQLCHDWQVVLVHGNGPQVGLLALQNAAYPDTAPYPLDVLVAETQGMIGYLLQQALHNSQIKNPVSCLMTQVITDSRDPAYQQPSKYIGPVYSATEAEALASHWQIKPDGDYYRRVVPSPLPKKIIDTQAILDLLAKDHLVICCGGGGIPVIERDGKLQGVEAVIDKDLAAALLAEQLAADALLILTETDAVYQHWNTPSQQALTDITCQQLRQLTFDAGSMAPKVAACCTFVDKTQGVAGIGALEDALQILSGNKGTRIHATLAP